MATDKAMQHWLERLGYAAEPAVLHRCGDPIPEDHLYALELRTLLKPDGAIRAKAVFDVEGLPTVVFVGEKDERLPQNALDQIRKRIWNQNLVSVVIEVTGDEAVALPARKHPTPGERLYLKEARADGPFSARDVATAGLIRRMPSWFDVAARVDRLLLTNLSSVVAQLAKDGFAMQEKEPRNLAQLLMGQVLFVSYLEHREIVGPTYRARRRVTQLHELVARTDRDGVRLLIDRLRSDFNGDFLGDDRHDPWTALLDTGFELLNEFLRQTDMETGQGNLWNYDFSYIPVELLSGLYEHFLTPKQQEKEGAYYTPRNLAVLAVNQAFRASPDPLSETIFDGACGSGILLTTAYRRLLALMEVREGRKLTFVERSQLLRRSIFGADINFTACRVTAFSLYLSLLEGLSPADILEAQDREGAKLPPLTDSNLVHGEENADFFRNSHRFHNRRFSLVISNPPWTEPEGLERTSADDWSKTAGAPFVRRQIAGAYALRALEFLAEEGRACFILPIGQFLGQSSKTFVSYLLHAYKPSILINLGDLQGLLFPTAENTCHVFVGERRAKVCSSSIPFGENFDYCVPKADLSLALGRLTLHSADRHTVQTRTVAEDPQLLVTMMWGDASDLALWTRLALRGTFGDLWTAAPPFRNWICRKGIHLNDKSRKAQDARPLRDKPFLPTSALNGSSPILHQDRLTSWPEDQKTVVGLNESVLAVFDGPRVLFPDGFSRGEPNLRAVYFDGPATFTHSIGVIAGRNPDDAELLQFAAVYLRSQLARYFLMMRGWKMLCERNGVHLSDVEAFPFFEPADAPDPQAARAALATITHLMAGLSGLTELDQRVRYLDLRQELDEAIFSYFDVDPEERALICETVTLLMPSIRPRSFKSLDTPAQSLAGKDDFVVYARTLAGSLTIWRNRTGGRGRFHVEVFASGADQAGPSGIARISYVDHPTEAPQIATHVSDELVLETLAELRIAGLRTVPAGAFLDLVPDAKIWIDGTLYLVRPLARRSWSVRQALRDAEQIVREVQSRASRQRGDTIP